MAVERQFSTPLPARVRISGCTRCYEVSGDHFPTESEGHDQVMVISNGFGKGLRMDLVQLVLSPLFQDGLLDSRPLPF